jgi:pimeloyl-ACP methyl ester carboxylesterase
MLIYGEKLFLVLGVAGICILFSVLFFLGLGIMLPSSGKITASSELDQYVEVSGYKIRYRTNNLEKTPVILLHGFGGDLTNWEKLAKSIKCGKAISIDLIGFGLSDKPYIEYDMETQRKYLLAYMDAVGIQKAVLVGSSMGASIALWTAAQSPERVLGLMIFAPSAYPGSMHHTWPGDFFYRPGYLNRFLRTIVGMKLFNRLFPNNLGRQAMDVTASYNQNFVKSLSLIRQPVFLIWSKGDKRVPFSYCKRYMELLKDVTFIEASENLGHNAASSPTPEILSRLCELISKAG